MEAQVHGVCEEESELGGPKFDPPVYKQRYAAVIEIARKFSAKKIVDVGCAECKLIRLLKMEPYVEELVGVDIDGACLSRRTHVVQPLTTDYLCPRKRPLHMALMEGSVAEVDARIKNFDLLSLVEVIEHLEPPVLERLPHCVFVELQPKVVVITTPNSEFNVLFPGFKGFRHPDHKFEWRRDEFQSWCKEVCVLCDGRYSVEYSGVGVPPSGSGHLGCCSQVAVFTRHKEKPDQSCYQNYKIVAESTHPYQSTLLSDKELLCQEAEYYLRLLLHRKELDSDDHHYSCKTDDDYSSKSDSKSDEHRSESRVPDASVISESDSVTIPLERLLIFPRVKRLSSSVEEIKSALSLSSWVRLENESDAAILSTVVESCDAMTCSDSEEDENDDDDVQTV